MPGPEQFSPLSSDSYTFLDVFNSTLSSAQQLSPDFDSSSDESYQRTSPPKRKVVTRSLFIADDSKATSEQTSPKRPSYRTEQEGYHPNSASFFATSFPDTCLPLSSSVAGTSSSPSTLFTPSSQLPIDAKFSQYLENITYTPAYTKGNERKIACFTCWQIADTCLEMRDASLKKLEIVTNMSSGSGVEKISLYIAEETLISLDTLLNGVLIFDFDMTLTIKPTIADDLCGDALVGYKMTQDERYNNIKHISSIQKILQRAKELHVKVGVVTRNDDIKNVLAYLQTLVQGISEDASISDYFSIVLCSPTPMVQVSRLSSAKTGMKDGELTVIAQLLGVDECGDKPMLLVDDEACNKPQKVGVGFAHVSENSAAASNDVSMTPDYISEINIFLNGVAERLASKISSSCI